MKRRPAVVLLAGLIAIFISALSGCGGSNSSAPIVVGLTSNISGSGIDQAQTASITASVSNDSKNAGVTWGVSGGGTLSGQTTTSATYEAPASVTTVFTAIITATSISDATKSSTLQIKVNPLPAISTTSIPAATAGTAYTTTLSESGGTGPFKWTVSSGALPAGLSLTSNTGTISGTPTGSSSASVTFEVTDAASNSSSQAITVTVNAPTALAIATTSLPAGTLGIPYSQTLQATGGVPSYSWSVPPGTLPAGLTLSSSGVISGSPTGPVGTSNFTVTVTDSQTPTPTKKSANLSIVIGTAPLSVTTTSLLGGAVGSSYSQTLTATGGTPGYTWSLSTGTLPGGLTLSTSTGVLSGAPTATGTSTFTVKVTDSIGGTATSSSLSIVVNSALAISTTSLAGGSVNAAYSATVQATGGVQPYTWSVTSGSLPAGLTMNPSTGVISGTPTATGTSNFTVTVQDSESPNVKASAGLSITIASASCPNNSSLSGNYAVMLNGWSGITTATAVVGSFVADGAGNISSGIVDFNDQAVGPENGTFTGTYCVTSNNLATITVQYGGTLIGTNTFAAALNSSGSNGSIIFYDSGVRKASGLLRKQDTTAFSTAKVKGNYAFGLVGANASAGRFAMAGQFSSSGGGALSGFYDSANYGTAGPISNQTLSSSNFSVASSGRGTAAITFTGQSTLNFVFYIVGASELLVMEDDSTGNPLLAGQVLQQTGSFTDASFSGATVIEVQSGSGGVSNSATAGIALPDGAGNIGSWSIDENQGGTTSSFTTSGSYSASSNGRMTLSLAGVSSVPVFYLIAKDQAFMVGTNNFTVDFGTVGPQSGSNFSNSSLNGAYQGGSFAPVDSSVSEEVDALQSGGTGSFTVASDVNGSGGTSTKSLSATYAVSSNGRVVVSQSGSEVGIIYLISTTDLVFLPSTDPDPKLSQFQH